MALDRASLRQKYVKSIYNGLKREFGEVQSVPGYGPVADSYWHKLAEAIADIAFDIVDDIQQKAEVQPGIQTSTGPTISTGKIL